MKEQLTIILNEMYKDLLKQHEPWWELQWCDAEFEWKCEIILEIKWIVERL